MNSSLRQPSLSGMKADENWNRWLAKGHAHDEGVRHRARLLAVSVGSLIALGLAIALAVR